MRRVSWLALGLVGMVGAARAEPSLPPPFTAATTLYLVTTGDGAARCEVWTTAPDPARPGQGVVATTWQVGGLRQGLAFEYAIEKERLRLHSYRYDEGLESETSGSCGLQADVRWDEEGLSFGRARWFVSAAGCRRALAEGEPVATDVDTCTDGVRQVPSRAIRTRGLQAFRRRLLAGGAMYVVDEDDSGALSCTRLRVARGTRAFEGLAGEMSWPLREDGGVAGRVILSLTLGAQPMRVRHGQRLLPDGTSEPYEPVDEGYAVTHQDVVLADSVELADGSSYGVSCGTSTSVEGIDGGVSIGDHAHYLSRAACRRAIAWIRLHRRWHSPADDAATGPLLALGPAGGC